MVNICQRSDEVRGHFLLATVTLPSTFDLFLSASLLKTGIVGIPCARPRAADGMFATLSMGCNGQIRTNGCRPKFYIFSTRKQSSAKE